MTKILSVLGREIPENRLLALSVSTDRGAVEAAISLWGRKVDGIVQKSECRGHLFPSSAAQGIPSRFALGSPGQSATPR
jgi:hypothetical protein